MINDNTLEVIKPILFSNRNDKCLADVSRSQHSLKKPEMIKGIYLEGKDTFVSDVEDNLMYIDLCINGFDLKINGLPWYTNDTIIEYLTSVINDRANTHAQDYFRKLAAILRSHQVHLIKFPISKHTGTLNSDVHIKRKTGKLDHKIIYVGI